MRTPGIDRLLREAARSPAIISFAGGLPSPVTFPKEVLAHAASLTMLEADSSPLQYDWPEGRQGLREAIAGRLAARGVALDAEDVVITNGAQDGLSLILGVLAPTELQVDEATYPGALHLFEGHGCTPRARVQLPVRYVMPAIHNPFGGCASAAQRAEFLSAELVIEDDAYADLRFDGASPTPLLAVARDRVFHLGSFSKTLSPGLRVGYVVPPPRWREAIRAAKSGHDLQASGVCQAIVEQVISRVDFDERLTHLRTYYGRRAARLTEALGALEGVRYSHPIGGFSSWLETGIRHLDDEAFLGLALKEGVCVDPGCLFRPGAARAAGLAMRLSFSAIAEADVAAGVERLGNALARARRS